MPPFSANLVAPRSFAEAGAVSAIHGSFQITTQTFSEAGSGAYAPDGSSGVTVFPLSVNAGGRYLQTSAGTPFFLHGDTAWSIVAQLSNAEITQYLNDRASRGVNTILLSAPEPYYTSQTPSYNNVDGVAPFTTMSPVNWASPNETYWQRVDHLVNSARALGMVCIINPAYVGYLGGTDGWWTAVNAESDADLQTYGAWLANRYTQGNVIWCLGGDWNLTNSTNRDKQWNIVTGIRSVRTSDIITCHPEADASTEAEAYPHWNGYTGFNLNNIYSIESDGSYVYARAAEAYARSMPFIGFEFVYEQERSPVIGADQLRRQSYGAILAGGCGQIFGNSPIWHFESSRAPFSYTGTWESNLNSTGSQQQQYVKSLFSAYQWWKLEPKTDASLVSSSLGTNATRVYPARANDGTFAMIYVPSSQSVVVVLSALTPSSVRARLYDPTTGLYSTVPGSPFSNTGSQSIATGGERVIVLDDATVPVSLAWSANPAGDNVTGYRVYYGTATGSYSAFVDTGNVTSYTFTPPATARYFALTAVNAGGESAFSNEISR